MGSFMHSDISLPIIRAPMAGSQASALATAVSESGALGFLPAAMLSLDALGKQLSILREKTRRPHRSAPHTCCVQSR